VVYLGCGVLAHQRGVVVICGIYGFTVGRGNTLCSYDSTVVAF